ncbi:uncharacterized protein Eint_081280 [Encephalitozoon intestinalis ATCC 50506]|uniref:Uncharacterized protein n=1 Tax=Encephalitozoon intestinalis (strain ATCC 50506) TaxID=876142 RepID=E0S8U3_ENCIT|nr:uncharacterized protein Eint_081280 [Encephalitozoon intestinalis ATCC 50506]ADM12060.1 hypothetical protein Eint_081280 [Encephalitozoon intestinalis ATCC 50506]UTX45850.1 hypothetical protein GPK93_08g14290 [Encephalitozoon intestinalis]
MALIKARIFKNVKDEWEDLCTGTILYIAKNCIFVEDDRSERCIEISLCQKHCGRSEKNVAIVYDDFEEYAICFEGEEIRDSFAEFMEKTFWSLEELDRERECTSFGKEVNLFAELLGIGKYADNSVFEKMLESRDGVLELLKMESLHLFKMLLKNGEKVFELFEVPSKSRVTPYGFYREIIEKNLGGSTARTFEDFLIIINRQELARSESKITEMSDEEIRDLLKRCSGNGYKIGSVETYLERIHRPKENIYLFETFYYLCFIFREKMSEAVDFKYILSKIKDLVSRKPLDDSLLYALEGLYILLDVCKSEKLDTFYTEVFNLLGIMEHHPDFQNLLLYLLNNHGFRAREFLINTGLMKKIFLSDHRDGVNEVFVSKVLLHTVSCSSRFTHRYFIRNDLFKNVARMYKKREKDAVYSIFLQAYSKADGDMKIYLDRYMQN